MNKFREGLENRQISIYFAAIFLACVLAIFIPGATALEIGINPALELMLFVTFLQVPIRELARSLTKVRFFAALLITNFIMVPILVALLMQFISPNPMVLLGVLLVLLTPCIDYVVTFSHLGHADAKLLLASTPPLLIVQMLLLPVYLSLFLGKEASSLVQLSPFIHAFIWLIVFPLMLAGFIQFVADKTRIGMQIFIKLGLLPVPATALVLFLVIASVVPQIKSALDAVSQVIPIYIAFAVISPFIGWLMGRMFHLDIPARRAIAFSASTRNSLVVLPLALSVPQAIPLLPAIIVTQTIIELISELIYIRLIPKLMHS